jgi:copper chaperone CopZ
MLKIKDKVIVQLWALRVSTLTTDTARKLESVLNNLPGVEAFTITLETQELHIVFDQNRLDVRTLVGEMAGAGCSLRDMSAALLL